MTSLAEQIVEIEKTVRDRVRTYPAMIERRRLLPETAEAKLAAMRAVQSTLVWLEANQHWIRPEAERRARQAREAAEIAALQDHPDVAAVAAAFPGAEIVGISDVQPLDAAGTDETTHDTPLETHEAAP